MRSAMNSFGKEEKTSGFERLVMGGLLAVLVWLPIPKGSNNDWSMGLLVMLVGLLGALWGTGLLAGKIRASSSWRAGLPLLVCLLLAQIWVAVQWLTGITRDTGQTFQYLMLGLSYLLLFAMILGLFHTRRRLTLLLAVLAISGCVQAFHGAFMTLSGIEWLAFAPKEYYRGDATGTFVNRNHLAGYLELTMACAIGLLLAWRDGRSLSLITALETLLGPKARLRLALVVMVIALVMTHSRGGNTGFFTALLVAGGILAIRDREHRKRNLLILTSIILIDILVISQYFGLERLKDRVESIRFNDEVVNGQVVERQTIDRDDVYRDAWPLVLESPWTGKGAGSFESVFQRHAGPELSGHFDHAHNDYLQFLIEYGVIGFLPLLAFVLLALRHALAALWQQQSTYRQGVGFGAVMALVALAVHSVSDFNLQIPANAATMVVLCAVAVLARTHKHQGHRHSRSG